VTEVAALHDTTSATGQALWQSMLAIGDDELISAHTLAHLCDLAGPALEPMLAVLSYVQDDTGHAIRWYELALSLHTDLGHTVDELAFLRDPPAFRCSALTEIESTDWYVVVGKNLLYKTADVARQRAMKEVANERVRDLVARTLDEDRFHESFWRLWASQLLGWDADRFRRTCVSIAADARSLFDLRGFWSDEVAGRLHEEWAAEISDVLTIDATQLLQPGRTPRGRGVHRDDFPAMIGAMQSVYRAYPGGAW
jgi:ring-1,2-phenylacetyl-CoA epoxidase subunit PaaC